MKTRVGHIIRYESPLILAEMLNAYFDEMDALRVPYTISGICLAIGYGRERFLSHETESEIGKLINQARLLIEQQHEHRLYLGIKPAGIMFALKNMGWSDRQDLSLNGAPTSLEEGSGVKYTIEVVRPDGGTKSIEHESEISNTGKVTPFARKKKAV